MAKIPEYNQIDIDNDSLDVIRAKIEAVAKALRERAKTASEEEKTNIEKLLDKPLGEWP